MSAAGEKGGPRTSSASVIFIGTLEVQVEDRGTGFPESALAVRAWDGLARLRRGSARSGLQVHRAGRLAAGPA